MNKYEYKGKATVSVGGIGEVKKGDTVETEIEINHPDFEQVGGKKKKAEAKKVTKKKK